MQNKTEDTEPERIHNPHDAAFKSAFQKKEIARSFFEGFLPEKFTRHIDFNHMELVNNSYVDAAFKEKHADIVYRTRIEEKTAFLYFLFEHQSSPDRWMAFRLLCYMVNIWKTFQDQNPDAIHLPIIIPMVLYHGKAKWNASKRFHKLIEKNEDFSEIIPDFTYRLYDLAVYDNESLRVHGYLLGVVLFLFKNIFIDDTGTLFDEMAEQFSKLKAHPDFLSMVEWAFRYAFHARDDNEQVVNGVISKLKDNEIKEAAMTIAEQIEQRGIRKGFKQGIVEGIESGLEKGLKKGLEKGLKQGVKKGLEDGLKKGEENKALMTARHLLSMGVLTMEQIAQATGLNVERIRALEHSASKPEFDGP